MQNWNTKASLVENGEANLCPINFGMMMARRHSWDRSAWRLLMEVDTSSWHALERDRETSFPDCTLDSERMLSCSEVLFVSQFAHYDEVLFSRRHVSSVTAWCVPTATGSSSCLCWRFAERTVSCVCQLSRASQAACRSQLIKLHLSAVLASESMILKW